jgi:hypothetical protein
LFFLSILKTGLPQYSLWLSFHIILWAVLPQYFWGCPSSLFLELVFLSILKTDLPQYSLWPSFHIILWSVLPQYF